MLIMIAWNKVLKGVCSRYDSMCLTMCNPVMQHLQEVKKKFSDAYYFCDAYFCPET